MDVSQSEQNHRQGRKFFFWGAGIYLAVLLGIGGFVGGVVVGSHGGFGLVKTTPGEVANKNAPPSFETKDVDFRQFWDIWQKVKTTSVHQPVNEPELFYGAIKGMVASLKDPYSVYFDPQESADFAKELEGKFEGIGAEIGFRDGAMIVVAPLPDTPASRAGLKAGDQILKINDEDTTGMALDVAVSKIRGPRGTSVKLSMYRDGWSDPKEFSIGREQIVVASVRSKQVDATGKEVAKSGVFGVITINQFNEDTVKMFDTAVRELTLAGVKGIVLDLRNDPGGYLDAAVEVAGGWVDHQVVVTERQYDGTETPFTPSRAATLDKLPTVVLVNKGSASASEIVAGALQDYAVATIVGETSFGKGSVQNYEELPDGSALKLTIAEWLTPKKRSIDHHGITPDVEVKLEDKDAEAGKDPQFDKAVEILKGKSGIQ